MRSIVKKGVMDKGKRYLTKFKLSELSSVDRPAQQPARALMMKRNDEDEDKLDKEGHKPMKKLGYVTLITSADEGHGHMLELWPGDDRNGMTNSAIGVGEDAEEHNHAWYIDEDGQVQVVMNAGHLHAVARDAVVNAVVAMVQKQTLDETTLEKFQKMFPELAATPNQEDIQMDEELKKSVERLEAIVALPADQRAHFDAIEKAEDKDAFLAKSADERAEIVKPVEKAEEKVEKKDEDPNVVYKSVDGTVFTKSDDPRLVAAIIEKDSKDREIELLKAEKADSEFEKRAEIELANLPGTVAQRASLLKSIESIENSEHREAALKALKAGNDAGKDVTKSLGTSEGANVQKSQPQGAQIRKSDAEVQLEDMAKAEAIKLGLDPVRDFAKAYNIVVNTAEGKDLYNQHRNAMISRLPN